jgi:hypothetical protein
MNPAWIGVVGTATGAGIGGGIGGALTFWGEHLRAARADRIRWLDLRRELAVRFLEATDEAFKWLIVRSNMLESAQQGMTWNVEGVTTQWEAGRKIINADNTIRGLHTEIDLVGSQNEREAAARLRSAVWNVTGPNSSDETLREHHEAREAFREAVRREIAPK